MSITPNAPSAAAIDAKIKALVTPGITPADLADQVLAQYTDLDTLKADIRWLLAEYGARQQRLLAMKVDNKPKRSHRKPPTPTAPTAPTATPAPGTIKYGDPDCRVKMPTGGSRIWKDMTIEEHVTAAQALRDKGLQLSGESQQCYQYADLHDKTVAALRLAAA
jgi:hypothetical protein